MRPLPMLAAAIAAASTLIGFAYNSAGMPAPENTELDLVIGRGSAPTMTSHTLQQRSDTAPPPVNTIPQRGRS